MVGKVPEFEVNGMINLQGIDTKIETKYILVMETKKVTGTQRVFKVFYATIDPKGLRLPTQCFVRYSLDTLSNTLLVNQI